MNYVVDSYENYKEENRLTTNNARRIEFVTTTRVLDEIIHDKSKILDCAAGTGIYSFWLADKGHEVRIIETFTKFNALDKTNFCNEVSGAKKLFDVNSHSIDDIEAELNGKTKQEVIQMFYDCFAKNDYGNHFLKYWKNVSIDETGKLVMEN